MKRDAMSSGERMERFFRGEAIDRVPFISSATMYSGRVMGLTCQEFYFDAQKSFQAQSRVLESICCDGSPCYDLPSGEVLDFGGSISFPEEQTVSLPIVGHPIRSVEEAQAYRLPELTDGLNFQKKMEFSRYALSHGNSSAHISGGTPFTMVGSMTEPSLMLRWIRKEPALIHRLLDLAEEYLFEFAKHTVAEFGAKRCSVTYNFPFENNAFINSKIFAEISLPSILRLHEKFIALGLESFSLHLCGDHRKNLDIFREIPLSDRSFISVDERNDLRDVRSCLGERHIYAGNLSSNLLVHGTSKEVYREAGAIIQSMKYNEGGFVLMPSCDLPINTKAENLTAMLRACRDFGSY